MDTEVILNNNSITLSFKKQLNNSQIYQLNYFGFNQSNLDRNDIFHGRINESKLVETINYLKKKKFEVELCSNTKLFLDDLKNNQLKKEEKINYLNLIKDKPNIKDFNEFVSSIDFLKRDLVNHQSKSLYHLYKSQSAAIFSVPGSGKTSVILAYYEKLKKENKVDALFVIGPVNCFVSWEDEFKLNIDRKLTSEILRQSQKKRRLIYDQKLRKELYLSHFSTISNDLKYLKNFFKINRFLLVVDEAHNIKKIDGKWSNAVLDLSNFAKFKVVLTGTPLPNDLRDVYNYLDILYGDNSVFTNKDKSKIEILLNKDKKEDAIELVREKIHPFYTRVTKKDLKLSKLIFNNPIIIDMNPIEQKIYDAILTKIKYYGKKSFLDNIDLIQKICKARIIRLKQAASYIKNLESVLKDDNFDEGGPLIDDKDLKNLIKNYDKYEKPAKLSKLVTMVKELKKNNKKVLIWSTHLKTIDLIKKTLNSEGVLTKVIIGEINKDLDLKRKIKNEFNDPNSSLDALVALPQACSESISLHKSCTNAIYYDLNYNAAEFLQSLDRIHRVGGSEKIPVNYNFLHYANSVDTKVYDRVFKKADRQMQIIEQDNLTFDLDDEEENWETLYNDLSL